VATLYFRFMNVFVFSSGPYKRLFWPAMTICLLLMAAAFTLHFYGLRLIKSDYYAGLAGDVLFYGSIAAAFWAAWQHQKRMRRIHQSPHFEHRLLLHETGFRKRLIQAVLGAALTCFLLLLTGKRAFVYYALFDVLSLVMIYPFPVLIKRELGVPGLVILK
jgi:hypothetical protein